MSQALRTGMAFGLKVMAGAKVEGLKPNAGHQQVLLLICLGWLCIASQVPNWLGPTFVAIEHWVQPPDCHFRPTCSILSWHTDYYF